VGLTSPTDFGQDISVFQELDATFAMVGGSRILAEALLRRITTPPGTLDFWPDYGFDVLSLLRESVDQATLFYARQGVINSIEQDERVVSCDCAVQYIQASSALVFSIAVEAGTGPFQLVVGVSDVAVKLLSYKEG